MNKVVKTIASTTLAFGTLLGVSSVRYQYKILLMQRTQTKGYYYSYNGYVDKDAKFLTDKNFINAIKHDNIKFNGIKLAKQIAQL